MSVCMHVTAACMYVVCDVCTNGEHHAPVKAMSGIYFAPGWSPKMFGCWHGAEGPGSVVALLLGNTILAPGLPGPLRGRVAHIVAHAVEEEGQARVQ